MTYDIIQASTAAALATKVSAQITLGMVPIGGPLVHDGLWYQAVVNPAVNDATPKIAAT